MMKRHFLLFLPLMLLLPSCKDTIEIEEEYRCPGRMIIQDYNGFTLGGCEKPFETDITLKAGDDFWTDLGVKIIKAAGEKLISFGTETGVNKALEYFYGDDTEKMNIVVGQFDNINKQMGTLLDLSEEILNKLDEARYNFLKTAFLEYKAELYAAASVNTEFIECFTEDITEEELKALILEWGDTPINGNTAKFELNNLLCKLFDFSYMYSKKQRNLFAVYDMIVFQNTPWEKDGYDIRESFRAYTAAVLAQTFYLTSLYYHYSKVGTAKSQEELRKSVKMAIDFCESHGNMVVRRDDAVCQIKDARFIVKNYASTDGSWCILQSNAYPFPGGQLTRSELDAIVSFYKKKGVSDDFTIIDCLIDGGLKISKESAGGHNPKIVLFDTSFTYRYLGGKMYTDCTLAFSGYADNVPVNSYKGSYCSVTYDNVPVYDYVVFDMIGNFMVAPEGITRYEDFN